MMCNALRKKTKCLNIIVSFPNWNFVIFIITMLFQFFLLFIFQNRLFPMRYITLIIKYWKCCTYVFLILDTFRFGAKVFCARWLFLLLLNVKSRLEEKSFSSRCCELILSFFLCVSCDIFFCHLTTLLFSSS